MKDSLMLIPLSLPQRDIYYEQLLYPGTPIYNIGAKIEILGNLDVDCMKAAYAHLIRQHDTFRSVLTVIDEAPYFKVLEETATELVFLDHSQYPDSQEYANRFMHERFKEPFLFESGKVLHAFFLIRTGSASHYLFSVYHHLITDGWGTSLMFRRFTEIYNELIAKGACTLQYSWSYTNFVDSSLAYRSSAAFREDGAYWQDKFSVVPELAIPAREAVIELASRRKEIYIDRAVYNSINDFSTTAGVSTFHTILAALYLYLARFYNNYNFSIGLPVLNRSTKEFKNTVGLFINVLPFALPFDPDIPFTELVQKVKETLKSDYRHQAFPFSHINRMVNLQGKANRIFNVTLSYEKHSYAFNFGDTISRVLPLTHESERVALAIYIREFDEREDVKIDFDYNLSYLDAAQMDTWTRHLVHMLQTVIAQPYLPVKHMPYMSHQEFEEVVYKYNQTQKEYPEQATLQQLITATVYNRHKTAIRDSTRHFTYGQVDDLSNQIAHYLQTGYGVTHDETIAIMMQRSAWLPVVMLGIMKSGAAYLPIDPAFPSGRVQYIIEQSRSRLLIADNSTTPVADQERTITILHPDHLIQQSGTYPATPPVLHSSASHLAYVIYTSGSTGQPKGVEIEHRAVVNFLLSMQQAPGITSHDKMLAVTTCSFDISVLEIFLPLITGAEVFIAGRDVLNEPVALLQLMADYRPTIMQGTPGLWNMLLDSGWNGDKNLKALCGGEYLQITLGQQLIEVTGELWNMYGPTETTIWSAINLIRLPEDTHSIGYPINNTGLYILDPWQQPVPVLAVGELCIGGAGLARGYRFKEELTKERFIDHPFVSDDKIYRTGDLGRRLTDGSIAFLGRMDNQVKLRGYRIEPEDIEKNLTALPGIKQAAVVPFKPGTADAYLVAFVVLEADTPITSISEQLKERLPAYMVPAVFIPLDALPVTPNGKINRKSLAALSIDTSSSQAAGRKPADAIETGLIDIWKELLGREDIGVEDNFFSLGGNSLMATKMGAAIQHRFEARLALATIFNHPSIEQLAQVITQTRRSKAGTIPVAPVLPHYPLAPAQYGIWLACQHEGGSKAYNMSAAFHLDGIPEKAILSVCVNELIARHESLRTAFVEVDGTPRQVILPADKISFQTVVHDVDYKKGEEALNKLVEALLDVEFDLSGGSLFTIRLVRLPGNEMIFIVIIHHIIADAWSTEVLLREINTRYAAQVAQQPYEPAVLPFQYKDFAYWLNKQVEEGKMELHKQFWLHKLGDYRACDILPADKKPALYRSFRGDMIRYEINVMTTSGLQQTGRDNNATLFIILVAVIKAVLYKQFERTDICIGTAVSCRDLPGMENQVGLYVNTVPLRTGLYETDTFTDLVARVRETVLEANEHQSYPYYLIMQELNRHTGQQTPLFDVIVTLQKPGAVLKHFYGLGNIQFHAMDLHHTVSRFPVAINFFEQPDGLVCEMEYNTDLFERGTLVLFMERMMKLITEVNKHSSILLNDIDIVLPAEQKLLGEKPRIDIDL